jgi:hypothetical protein
LHDAGRPQQAALDRVSILDDTDDGSGRFCALFHGHRFVQRRIETLAQRLDPAHAETLERQREQAPGGFDAFDQRSLPAARLLPNRSKRALQIVGDGQELTRKIRDRGLPRLAIGEQ